MPDSTAVAVRGNVAIKEGFSERELMQRTERAAVAQAAKAKAEVEARYAMSLRNPRDIDQVRHNLLKECDRPDFAIAARYSVPNRGSGFSIRFAEAAAAAMGNVYVSAPVIVEDDDQRTICVTVMDLERNLTWTKDVVIIKTVERKNTEGREVVRYRQKADGSSIAIVRATDEELLTKENSLVSKASRTGIERIIPPDLKAECLKRIGETLKKKDKDDPDSARKAIADAFAELGVAPKDLKEYCGCELASLQPSEFPDLRELYTALKEGHVTWREVMAQKRGENADEPEPSTAATTLKEKIKAKTESHGKPMHVAKLEAYRTTIGDAAFDRILGLHKFKTAADVPAEAFEAIQMDILTEIEQMNERKKGK